MKFSIRDLLLVTVIVATLTAWWVDRSRLAAENKQLKENSAMGFDYGTFFLISPQTAPGTKLPGNPKP